MSRLGEALGSLAITMVSPDGHIQLESRGGRRPVVTFVDSDAYFDYDAGALKAQLEALLVGFAAELRAARHTAVREHSKLGVNDSPHWNAEVRRANEQQLNVASFGTSIDEFVVTGLARLDGYPRRECIDRIVPR